MARHRELRNSGLSIKDDGVPQHVRPLAKQTSDLRELKITIFVISGLTINYVFRNFIPDATARQENDNASSRDSGDE